MYSYKCFVEYGLSNFEYCLLRRPVHRGVVAEEKMNSVERPRELFSGEIFRPVGGAWYRQIEKTASDRRERLRRQADDDLSTAECSRL